MPWQRVRGFPWGCHMRSNARSITLLSCIFLLAPTAGNSQDDGEAMIEGIAAQVGNEIVLISEVQELARPMEGRMRDAGAPEAQIQNIQVEALERLIDSKVIATAVTRYEMEASPEDIDNAVADIARSNGITPDQLKASVQNHGLTMAEYRGKLKGEIERSKIINAMVSNRVRVEPEEVERLYRDRYGQQLSGGDEIRLRHILIAVGQQHMRDEGTACAIAQEAVTKIRAGELDFTEAARQLTDVNPEQQGELGWLHLDDIAPWMDRAIAPLKPGQVTDPIPTPFGCNVLELVERRSFEPITLEQATPSLHAEISQQKTDREILDWIETLRKQTFISRKGVYAEGQQKKPSSIQ